MIWAKHLIRKMLYINKNIPEDMYIITKQKEEENPQMEE